MFKTPQTRNGKYAEELRFEDAEICKQRYLALDNFAAKSEIVSYTITDD